MPSFGSPILLGYLEEDGCDELASGRYQILDGQELMIGRDYKTCDIILTDPTVSNQHMQIYTVSYADDDHQRIFTYAKDLSTNGSYWRYKDGSHWKELLIGQGKAALLSDGERVRLCNGSSFIFRSAPGTSQVLQKPSAVHDEDTKSFMNMFKIMDRKLGSGAYGEVWMAVDLLHQRQMACKVVKLNKPHQTRSGKVSFSGSFWREVDLLKDTSHVRIENSAVDSHLPDVQPNILHVERVFFTEVKLYMISDLVTGGDLMSYIDRPWTKISEAETCLIIYQLLKALEYLHRQGICHRDIKPENILMSTPAPGARVILADFGHSIKLSGGKLVRNRRMKTASVGTDYYVAPEVRGKQQNSKGYTMATDMWSLGIISTLLLTGEFVFEDFKNVYVSPAATLDAVAECNLAKIGPNPIWQGVSDIAKDFVSNILILDEEARFDVEQALEHGWFTDSKCREDIQQQYEDAIRGWMPSRPLLDFKQDLAVFREASRSTLDSILMPPPAKLNSKPDLRQPSHGWENGQRSSPFFSQALQEVSLKMTPRAPKKRDFESDDEADKPSILPERAISASKLRSEDSRESIRILCEANKADKSSVMQIVGGEHENVSHIESSQRQQQLSIDLDYKERRLYDRVSREEATMFKSAKSYRQSVEKRRRLGS